MILINNKAHARELIYRPVTLTVLDAETKQPLEGVTITVINVTFYSKAVWKSFIPIDTTSEYVHYMYKYTTNEKGVVEIPQFKYKVTRDYFLLEQKIILNLELRDEFKLTDDQAQKYDFVLFYDENKSIFFFRSKREYKAGVIYCDVDSEELEQLERTKPYITVVNKKYKAANRERNQTSFFSAHENFTFYLERFTEVSSNSNPRE